MLQVRCSFCRVFTAASRVSFIFIGATGTQLVVFIDAVESNRTPEIILCNACHTCRRVDRSLPQSNVHRFRRL